MIGDDHTILADHPECLSILRAYARWEAEERAEKESAWRSRLVQESSEETAEPENADTSSTAHGLLIAYGFLDIELVGRTSGIHYSITTSGKRALRRLDATEESASVEMEADNQEETVEVESHDVDDLAA